MIFETNLKPHPGDIFKIQRAFEARDSEVKREPNYRRLFSAIRGEVLAGNLAADSWLPPSRTLARTLGVSRNTVIQAYEQLAAEGYIVGHVGQGTRIASLSNVDIRRFDTSRGVRKNAARVSKRGKRLTEALRTTPIEPGTPFIYGMPCVESFPFSIWRRLLQRHSLEPLTDTIAYPISGGLPALRAAVCKHLGPARGVDCDPKQIIVVTSAQAAIDLTARLLLDEGDVAWIEDPGYLGARMALQGAGARLVPVPVDEFGMDITRKTRGQETPRLIYVTPSSQFPTGTMMSLDRRLLLLDWARRCNAWIIEDDYDSEYRYRGQPLTALQSLDERGQVIYVGTFSKTMFPGLRLAYLVVPERLVENFGKAVQITGQESAQLVQAALADFIEEGHFATHVRRMRTLYSKRQNALRDSIDRYARNRLTVQFRDAGMQALAYIDARNDVAISAAAKQEGIKAAPLSPMYLGTPPKHGLILGYTSVPQKKYGAAIKTLTKIIEKSSRAL
ncbi:MAG: PLP-dependent aminotransferase family protein [Pseudomonadota bacterium]